MVETIPTTHTPKIILGEKLKAQLRQELRMLSAEWNSATQRCEIAHQAAMIIELLDEEEHDG